MEEAKEAQLYFERLMAVRVPVAEAVELCGYPAHANLRIRREKGKLHSLNQRRQECVVAIPAEDAQIRTPMPLPRQASFGSDTISQLTQELRDAGKCRIFSEILP
jgi:hypothetical protein